MDSLKKGDFVRVKIFRTDKARRDAVEGFNPSWVDTMDKASGHPCFVLDDVAPNGCVGVRFVKAESDTDSASFNKGWLIKIKDPRAEIDDATMALLNPSTLDEIGKKRRAVMDEVILVERNVAQQFSQLRKKIDEEFK